MQVNPINVIRLLLATFQAMQISESPINKNEIELVEKFKKILFDNMDEIHAAEDNIWNNGEKDEGANSVQHWRSVTKGMDRWNGKVAVVTGASSGIGFAIAKALVQQGLTVVGLARRKAQMENNMKNVKGPGKFYAKKCDITKEQSVIESLNWANNTFGSLNILINSAGTVKESKIEDVPTADLEHVINVNLMGLLYCTKQAIILMKENQKEAHIVNINDAVVGHNIPPNLPRLNVYPATKFAVRALTQTLRTDLSDTKIRITSVSPGGTKSEMSAKTRESNPNWAQVPLMEAEDVANSILYVLGTQPHIEVNELIFDVKKT